MWTLQSTSTHKGPRGHVFSPCLKWKGPIHHWLFVTETEATESICVYSVRLSLHVYACINYTHCVCVFIHILCKYVCVQYIYECVSAYKCDLYVRFRGKIRGYNNAFSASKYPDCSIYFLHSFDKSCPPCLTLY